MMQMETLCAFSRDFGPVMVRPPKWVLGAQLCIRSRLKWRRLEANREDLKNQLMVTHRDTRPDA